MLPANWAGAAAEENDGWGRQATRVPALVRLLAQEGGFVNIRAVVERKLQMLHRAAKLDDLRIPPNNRLAALKGDRAGTYSIRINDQWRLCFRFEGGHAFDVEILDYH